MSDIDLSHSAAFYLLHQRDTFFLVHWTMDTQALTALATSDEHTGKCYDTQLFTSLTSVGFYNIRCVNGKEAHDIMEWHVNKTAGTNDTSPWPQRSTSV